MDLVMPLLFVAIGAIAVVALDRLGVMIPESSWGGMYTALEGRWFWPSLGLTLPMPPVRDDADPPGPGDPSASIEAIEPDEAAESLATIEEIETGRVRWLG